MERNVQRESGDCRPYWKVVASLALSLIGTVLFIVIGVKALLYFMPFVIGWFLAFIASPLVTWLEKRLKIVKKLGSVLIVILVLGGCVLLLYFGISRLWSEIISLIRHFPAMYKDLENGFREIGDRCSQIFALFPEGVQRSAEAIAANLDQTAGELIGRISEPTVEAAGSIAKRIPSILIAIIVTIISAYFFISDREKVIDWAKNIFPSAIVKRMTMVMDNLKYAVGGYFKAQLKIMAVVFGILLIGFAILDIHFSILLALGIALLDFLPFFGTGTALIPWGIYELLMGDYRMLVALIILYAVTQLVRQLIQPKLVGDSMGLNPLLTLVLLYAGYKFAGLLGMIFAVPIGMIMINLYKAGAFDYILDDVKILIEGIMKLRADDNEREE